MRVTMCLQHVVFSTVTSSFLNIPFSSATIVSERTIFLTSIGIILFTFLPTVNRLVVVANPTRFRSPLYPLFIYRILIISSIEIGRTAYLAIGLIYMCSLCIPNLTCTHVSLWQSMQTTFAEVARTTPGGDPSGKVTNRRSLSPIGVIAP